MAVRAEEIASILKEQIEHFDVSATSANVGTVIEAGDGIARIHGLGECLASELIEFGVTDDAGRPIRGLALNLEEETVGAIIMGDYTKVKEGDEVRTTGLVASVPVGEALIGRVVNALGDPVDEKGPVGTTERYPVERIAPDVLEALADPVVAKKLVDSGQAVIPQGPDQLAAALKEQTAAAERAAVAGAQQILDRVFDHGLQPAAERLEEFAQFLLGGRAVLLRKVNGGGHFAELLVGQAEHTGFGDAAAQGLGPDLVVELIAAARAQLLGIPQTGDGVKIVEDHGCGPHRPRQRPAARFVDTGHQTGDIEVQAHLLRQRGLARSHRWPCAPCPGAACDEGR